MRAVSAITAGGAVMFAWLGAVMIQREASLAPAWWTWLALFLVFGAPVIVGVIVLLAPLSTGRTANAIGAALYLVAVGGSLVLTEPSPWVESAWALNITALGTTMAALAMPRIGAWFYNGVVALLVVVERVEAPGGGAFAAVQHGLYSFASCAVFMALVQLVLIQARRVDARTARAARQAADVETARARHAERARVDAVLHDTVLATLMLASRGDGRVDPELRLQASEALVALDAEPPDGSSPDDDIDPVGLIRERMTRLDARIPVSAPSMARPVPRAVAEALVDAAIEAARNSLRHAELPLGETPTVSVTQKADRTELVVADDGIGFSSDGIERGRLGLRSSIVGRLERVPGATADIDSAPGQGTRVTLSWTRER